MISNLDVESYHVAFGVHSKIPLCCINFFVSDWNRAELWRLEDRSMYDKALQAANVNYVMCPDCLGKGNSVKIRNCFEDCGGEHQQDFMRHKEATNGYSSDTSGLASSYIVPTDTSADQADVLKQA